MFGNIYKNAPVAVHPFKRIYSLPLVHRPKDVLLVDISFSKASPRPAGQQAAYSTQICPLFKKGLRSVLRAPLVTNDVLRARNTLFHSVWQKNK